MIFIRNIIAEGETFVNYLSVNYGYSAIHLTHLSKLTIIYSNNVPYTEQNRE